MATLSDVNKQTKVKLITNMTTGTPALKNEWKSLVSLLKTVLVDGYNSKVPTGVESHQGDIKKIKFAAGHGYVTGQVIRCTAGGSNKEYRVLDSDAEYVYIHEPSSISKPDTVIGAPLGFSLAYDDISNTGVACFKNASTKSPAILKVIDNLPPNGYTTTWAKFARVVCGKAIDSSGNFVGNQKVPFMVGVENPELTGNGVSGASGIHGWLKWYYALRRDAGYSGGEGFFPDGVYPTEWIIVGDNNTFYLFIRAMGAMYGAYNIYSFGAYTSNNPQDTTNIQITGCDYYTPASYQNSSMNTGSSTASNVGSKTSSAFNLGYATQHYFSGNYLLGDVGGQLAPEFKFCTFGVNHSTTSDDNIRWPQWADQYTNAFGPTGNIFTCPLYMKASNGYIRGVSRGVLYPVASGAISSLTYLDNFRGVVLNHKKTFRTSFTSGTDLSEVPLLFSLEDWSEV